MWTKRVLILLIADRKSLQEAISFQKPKKSPWALYKSDLPKNSLKCLRGLARYTIHFTATALTKLLHNFLYMFDPHPYAQNYRNGPNFSNGVSC